MAEPSSNRPAPTPPARPDPVHHAVLHVLREVGVVMPVEDRERFARAIAQRAGALRDAQLRAALDQVEAVGRAVPPAFQVLAMRRDGLVDLAQAVRLMAKQAGKTEANWLDALALARDAVAEQRRAVEHLKGFAEAYPEGRTAETEAILFMAGEIEAKLRALAPFPDGADIAAV